MNLDELRSVLDDERDSGSLQPLRPAFYAEAREFVGELKRRRDELAAESAEPFSDEAVVQLTDRLATASEVLESIFENRTAKLLRHAATDAAGTDTDPPALTVEERHLYETLVAGIRTTKRAALDGDDAEIEIEPTSAPPVPPTPEDQNEAEAVAEPDPEPEKSIDRLTVRVTTDVGTILGVDEREYDLQSGDVVSLPIENANALIERDVAVDIGDEPV